MLIIKDKKIINLKNVTHSSFGESSGEGGNGLASYYIRFYFNSYSSHIQTQEIIYLFYDNEKDRENDFNKIILAYDSACKILEL